MKAPPVVLPPGLAEPADLDAGPGWPRYLTAPPGAGLLVPTLAAYHGQEAANLERPAPA